MPDLRSGANQGAHQFSPYPVLNIQNGSGLNFPWVEYNPKIQSTASGSAGPEGANFGMVMMIYAGHLTTALQELLGYSWREAGNPGTLHRNLPWQHPYFKQLWVQKISRIEFLQQTGKGFGQAGGNAGAGAKVVVGPWNTYAYALLTVQFWRPPYYVRSDQSVGASEWLRYLDKNWHVDVQMLSREGMTFVYAANQGNDVSGKHFVGSVGQKVPRLRMKRTWYQVPEQCIFKKTSTTDLTLNGLPYNMVYTQTAVTNPVTGYVYTAGQPILGCVNTNVGGMPTFDGDTNFASPVITNVADTSNIFVGDEIIGPGIPVNSVVTALVVDTSVTISNNAQLTAVGSSFLIDRPSSRFLGLYPGTALFVGAELNPRPLQMPASFMQVPFFANNEPIAQLQYDVTLHFDVFDPPCATFRGLGHRGHNNMPWAGDGLWYTVIGQNNATGTNTLTTPFNYCDFADLFKVL